jgi:prephenate dehydratase
VLTIVHDRPGTLTNVLAEFATRGINLQSIQSVRAGSQLRFHICLDRPASDPAVQEVGRELHDKGLIKLFESSLR